MQYWGSPSAAAPVRVGPPGPRGASIYRVVGGPGAIAAPINGDCAVDWATAVVWVHENNAWIGPLTIGTASIDAALAQALAEIAAAQNVQIRVVDGGNF